MHLYSRTCDTFRMNGAPKLLLMAQPLKHPSPNSETFPDIITEILAHASIESLLLIINKYTSVSFKMSFSDDDDMDVDADDASD